MVWLRNTLRSIRIDFNYNSYFAGFKKPKISSLPLKVLLCTWLVQYTQMLALSQVTGLSLIVVISRCFKKDLGAGMQWCTSCCGLAVWDFETAWVQGSVHVCLTALDNSSFFECSELYAVIRKSLSCSVEVNNVIISLSLIFAVMIPSWPWWNRWIISTDSQSFFQSWVVRFLL